MAKAFLEDTKDVLETMSGAIDRHDTQTVKKGMHKLAGCCASIMDKEGQKLARQIEDLARRESWQSAQSAYATLCESLIQIRRELAEYAR
jgi:HPt (histidine-containing phosphotransfer) domain-containing protein